MSEVPTKIQIRWYTTDPLFSADQVVARIHERVQRDHMDADILRPFVKDIVVERTSTAGIQTLTISSDSAVSRSEVMQFVIFFRGCCLGHRLTEVEIDGVNTDTMLLQHVTAVERCIQELKGTMSWLKDDRIARIRRALQRNTDMKQD